MKINLNILPQQDFKILMSQAISVTGKLLKKGNLPCINKIDI